MVRVRGAVPVVVALVLALLAIGLLGFSSTLNPVDALLGRGAVVSVPDVVGAPRPRAEADLEAVDLRPEVSEAFSLSAPRGTVVRQDPEAGALVRQGDSVSVVVSKGANRVVMPDAVGQPLADIIGPFEDADIPVKVERVPNERVPRGIVMEQSPGVGLQVTGLDAVSFVVSDGPADRAVPDVVGRTVDGAAFELGQSGLTLGVVSFADDPRVPVGAVVSASPAPGRVVPIETGVDLVVSNGPAVVPVPAVVNSTETAARDALEALGFRVALAAKLLPDDASGVGAVVDQYPAAGTEHRPGDVVTIVVGREMPAPPPPRTTTTTTSTTSTTTTTTTAPRR